jgi:hypothetical protein
MGESIDIQTSSIAHPQKGAFMSATQEPLNNDSHKLWEISRKLESLGIVLERQGEGEEGFTALHGFGMILSGMSVELEQISSHIEEAAFSRRRAGLKSE